MEMNKQTNSPQGLSLPPLENGQENSPSAAQSEKTYLMEALDGSLIRVPESRAEAWQEEQNAAPRPLNSSEQRLKDRIVQMLYGEKK